jgi:hypothetical protein
MDYVKVLRRAGEITWRYRALWVFGIILALTTGGGATPLRGGGNGGVRYVVNGEDLFGPGGEFPIPEGPPNIVGILIAVGVALACVIVILVIASLVARFVAETALVRMVDEYEETGERHSVRRGFRIGWSRTAWRLFLVHLLTNLPVALAFILLFVLALAPLLVWTTESVAARAIGTVATIGLFFLVLFLAIVVGTALSLLMHFFRRACVLEELDVIESIRQGFGVVRRHLKDVAIMWLLMVGLQLGLAIAMIVAVILFFPVIILLMIVGGVLGGLPALIVGGLASLVLEGAVPWILGAVVGIPIFALVVAAPWLFLGGLVEVFKSSVWTLTYRELRALEGLEPVESEPEPEELPALDAPGLT